MKKVMKEVIYLDHLDCVFDTTMTYEEVERVYYAVYAALKRYWNAALGKWTLNVESMSYSKLTAVRMVKYMLDAEEDAAWDFVYDVMEDIKIKEKFSYGGK